MRKKERKKKKRGDPTSSKNRMKLNMISALMHSISNHHLCWSLHFLRLPPLNSEKKKEKRNKKIRQQARNKHKTIINGEMKWY